MTSVIVAMRDAAPLLPQLFESLVFQQVDVPWEVVAVDNGSRDGSASIAASYAMRLAVRVIEAPGRANVAYARNAGVRAASGSRLLFVDGDDTVAPGYVATMHRALDRHPFVTSRVDSSTLNPAWVQGAHGPPWQADGVARFFGFLPAAGSNIGVRRDVFEQLGGFPESCFGSEDIAFSWLAQLAGVDVVFVRDAVYHYRYRQSLPALFAQARHWGRANVRLYATFRHHGMPGRPWRLTADEWADVLRRLLRSRTRAERAPLVVRLGFCVGRCQGSLRYRVSYF